MSRELTVSNLSKSFGATAVLNDVSLAIPAGEFVTLLGPSGCGKTTLLRIIAGLERPDVGAVRLGNEDLLAQPPNRRPVNMVFQSYALFPHLTVARNITFGLRARRLPGAEVDQRLGEALELLRLTELAGRRPHQLSGGQKQRVALARALVNRPALLLLDEPLSALDAALRADLQLELRKLQRTLGTTFLLVTHDQEEALTVSDRIFLMNEGKIEQQGPAAEVYNFPRTRFAATFLGAANLLPARHLGGGRFATAVGELDGARAAGWAEGHLAVRPEHVGLGAMAGRNAFRATVEDVVYRGDHQDVTAAGVRARVAATVRVAAGDEVTLELPAEFVHPVDP